MTSRRAILGVSLAAIATAMPLRAALAAEVKEGGEPSKQGAGHADFLFVQSAKKASYDKGTGKLTLVGVSPQTLFFSDRPERIAGNMSTKAFVPFWSQGKDSFLSDPPNADISILDGVEMKQVVAVLEKPELAGEDLTYTIKLIEGEMPGEASDVSVFIDIIGMPLTPLSFAGARRRAFRRAYYWR